MIIRVDLNNYDYMDGGQFKYTVVYYLEMSFKDQFDKIDDYYAKKIAQDRGQMPSEVKILTDPVIQYNSTSDLKMNSVLNPSNGFKQMEKDKEKMKKYRSQTKTK